MEARERNGDRGDEDNKRRIQMTNHERDDATSGHVPTECELTMYRALVARILCRKTDQISSSHQGRYVAEWQAWRKSSGSVELEAFLDV